MKASFPLSSSALLQGTAHFVSVYYPQRLCSGHAVPHPSSKDEDGPWSERPVRGPNTLRYFLKPQSTQWEHCMVKCLWIVNLWLMFYCCCCCCLGLPEDLTGFSPPLPWHRCRVRVIDTFGTEPAYNHEEYATLHGYRTNWGYWNLNAKQFMTMFRK